MTFFSKTAFFFILGIVVMSGEPVIQECFADTIQNQAITEVKSQANAAVNAAKTEMARSPDSVRKVEIKKIKMNQPKIEEPKINEPEVKIPEIKMPKMKF